MLQNPEEKEYVEFSEALCLIYHDGKEPTNNRSERNARREAEIRKGARTSKTAAGAKRRGVIVTVFASLRTQIANFTLAKMLDEIDRWTTAGISRFEKELATLKANLPPPTQNADHS